MNNSSLKIAIADPSVIVRSGLVVALKRIPSLHLQIFEIASIDLVSNYLRLHKPDLLIINPSFWGTMDVQKLKDENDLPDLKCFALLSAMLDENLLKVYDDRITLYDTVEQLGGKLQKVIDADPETDDEEMGSLSQREKEILVCVVKGLTNKEIAQALFLSTHTVITHRRNIARKLEIHSTAGLTIYAIVNKLVELDEIKKDI